MKHKNKCKQCGNEFIRVNSCKHAFYSKELIKRVRKEVKKRNDEF